LPMWLVGCNPNVTNGCLTRDLDNGNVTGVSVQSGVCCSSCKCGKSTCCCGGYDCYSCSIGIDTPNGHCDATVGGTFGSFNDAQNAGKEIGNHTQVEIDPRTHLCSIYLFEYQVIWTVGVVFLCLTAALCCCCCCRYFCCSNTTVSKTPDFNSPEFNPDSDNTSVQLPDIQGQSSSNVIVSTQTTYTSYNQQTNSTDVISVTPPTNTDNNNNNSHQGFSFPQRSISDNDLPRRPSGADQEEGKPSNTNLPKSSSLPEISENPTTTTTTDDGPPAYDDAPPAYE